MSCKVSVIVPVYNVEKYLKKCLDSIIDQTLEDIEIICVNDGSTDNSLAVLQEYQTKDNRIKIITQENRGLSGARNTGMRHVTGKYILFVDSDDWIEPNALESLFNYAEKFNLDVTFYSFRYFYQEEHTYEESDHTVLNTIPRNLDNKPFNYKDISDILFEIPHNAVNKLYNTEFLRNLNVTFTEGKKYEDVDFYFKTVLNAQKLGINREIFYNYRIRNKSITTSGDEGSFDIFHMLEIAEKLLKDKGIYSEIKQSFFKFLIVNFKYVYLRINDKYKVEFFKLLRKNYIKFNLDQVDDSINKWHFDDRVFYQAITLSANEKEFELTYKKLYYEFLANHYEGLVNALQNECDRLNQELNKNTSLKNQIKGIFK